MMNVNIHHSAFQRFSGRMGMALGWCARARDMIEALVAYRLPRPSATTPLDDEDPS
jgi:hypothetical protein